MLWGSGARLVRLMRGWMNVLVGGFRRGISLRSWAKGVAVFSRLLVRAYSQFFPAISGVGKTQILLTLLLSAQLPPPHGLSRPSLYISTEHPLPTTRLIQVLQTHPLLSTHSSPPSLSRILTLQTPDLESQEHILTYQLPVALARHNIGLCIIDSIAANFRAEADSVNSASALAHRSAQLIRLGALLRSLARIHNCAFVVANQVADRFPPTHVSNQSMNTHPSSPYSSAPALPHHPLPLSLDHQQRFFTGWGANPSSPTWNLKTPSLGLVWANQIDCRIALVKEAEYGAPRVQGVFGIHSNPTGVDVGVLGDKPEAEEKSGAASGDEWRESAEWAPRRWRRWMRLVFGAWVRGTAETDKGAEFEIWAGGVRAIGEGVGDRTNGSFEGSRNETE